MGEVGAELKGWLVHLSVTAHDGQALLGLDPEHYGDHGARLLPSAESDRQELVLHSRELDRDRARGAVVDHYTRLRRAAGLAAEPALVVSLERPGRPYRSPDSREYTLMTEAKRVLDIGSNFEWAVVLAQTACEVYVRDILERCSATLGEAAVDTVQRLPSSNLASASVRRVFREMTGYTPPAEADWWHDYQAHAQRRHRIVHAGDRVTRADAEDSLAAAKAMIGFLHWPSQRIEADVSAAASSR